MSNNNVECIDCSHYAVCRFKDNMNEVRENINKMKHNDKNKNLDITVDCVYYVNNGTVLRAKVDDAVDRVNVTISDIYASPRHDIPLEYRTCSTTKVNNGEPGV